MSRKKNVPITAARIRLLRAQAGLSQADMGRIVGASKSSISEYENGDTKVSIDILRKYAEHFHVNMDYLTGEDQDDPQAAIPLFTSSETALILGYRHKSAREQKIIRLQAMSDEEYNSIYGNEEKDEEMPVLLSDQKNDNYGSNIQKKK